MWGLLLRRKLLLLSMSVLVLLSSGLVVSVEADSIMWSQTYGGTANDIVHSLVATSDGGYAMAGETKSLGFSADVWLVKTNETGYVPKYSSWVLLSIMLVATFVIVIYKKKRST